MSTPFGECDIYHRKQFYLSTDITQKLKVFQVVFPFWIIKDNGKFIHNLLKVTRNLLELDSNSGFFTTIFSELDSTQWLIFLFPNKLNLHFVQIKCIKFWTYNCYFPENCPKKEFTPICLDSSKIMSRILIPYIKWSKPKNYGNDSHTAGIQNILHEY